MTALSDLVPALKRELAVPGTFDDTFPDTGTSDLVGTLADGFAEAQLYGFFSTLSLDVSTFTVTPDLSTSGASVIIIFSAMKVIRGQLRNLLTTERYASQGNEVEFGRSAQLLREELQFLQQRLADLIAIAQQQSGASLARVFDGYASRGGLITRVGYGVGYGAGWGFFDYEYC